MTRKERLLKLCETDDYDVLKLTYHLIEENEKLRGALESGHSALYLLMKRVTKLGEIIGEPDSPIDIGWKASDKMRLALESSPLDEFLEGGDE